MRRREFIALIGASTALPFAARAQRPAKMARIGYLTFRTPNSTDDAFLLGLRELNWTEAQNIVIERRHPAGNVDRLNEFAAELVRMKPDVIVTAAGAATQAVKDANGSVPIVFLAVGDPVGQRLVESLSHPGGNVTGVSFDVTPDITAKQVQLLTEAIPNLSRIAVLWNSASPFLRSCWSAVQAAAPALRVNLQSVEVLDAKQFERAFDMMTHDRAEALIVLSDSFATFNQLRLSELAAAHRLPAIYGHSGYVAAGGLMSYGPSLASVYRRGASYVDKILKGANTADLPVEQPTKFELVVNLKAVRSLGLTISSTVLARADKVIE